MVNDEPLTTRPLRILFLLPFAPRLDGSHGGARVTAELLTRLGESHRLAVIYLRAGNEPSIDEAVRSSCEIVEEVVSRPTSKSFRRRWSNRARLVAGLAAGRPQWATGSSLRACHARVRSVSSEWRPDLVQAEYHVMAQYFSALADAEVPRVVTQHEPGAQAAYDQQELRPGRGLARLVQAADAAAWRHFEQKVADAAQAIVVFTERDREAVERLNDRATRVVRIPFGVAPLVEPLDPLGTEPPTLLFVGSFIHSPNVDAAMRLTTRIFPLVRAGCPAALLDIVGGEPPVDLVDQAGDGVTVTGFVPSVVPYLDRAAIVVAPIRSGGGMRVKIVEALAAGKVVVASRLAVEGLDVVDGEQAVLAETDGDFRDRILELLGEPDRRRAIAARAHEFAAANLTWDRTVDRYEELYRSLLNREFETPAVSSERTLMDRSRKRSSTRSS